jgi:hypothetical protein
MARPFTIELAMPEPPSEAAARAAIALAEPARAIGLRLAKRTAGALQYTPRVQFPFLIMLWHNLNGERMTVSFVHDGNGGTRISISGRTARGSQSLAADPDHWAEPLSATTVEPDRLSSTSSRNDAT